ncbi:MAG TPA: pre-peptidase C-terminal domain-containing protein [Crinalium sp.]|jgi:hypothetical protein
MFNNLQSTTRSQLSDNRLSGARKLGFLNGRKAVQGFVGLSDKIDCYSFKLTGRSSFKLVLNKLQNNVDVFLLQGRKVISRSAKPGKKPEAINTTLEAGTYYIRVNQRQGNSKYKLTLSGTSLSTLPTPTPTPTPPSSTSRKLVSLLAGGDAARLGSLDLGTGNLTRLPLGNLGGTVLWDIATFGNDTFAVANPNNFYRIDPTTSTYTLVGSLGVSNISSTVNSLGFTSSGALYAAGTSGGFYSINTTTGKATLIAPIPGFAASGDLAYDATSGRFFATSTNSNGTDSLYSIGLTGDAQLIGNVGFKNVWGLLFDNGVLYGFTPQEQIRINLTTGAGTLDKVITPDGPTSGVSGAA